ncbi:YlzJ-like family protein [Moorella naiadis]|uniref:YlzJ-like family protein n=1 Tax=Moorella naiadis (nom. illeg.) TaxID=3093670 RepID=UPI003D9CA98F
MYVYSPIPPELIWEGMDNFCPQRQELKVGEVTLEVEPLGFNQARVVRLISTDPADYLNSPFQPGCIINFAPESITDPSIPGPASNQKFSIR